MEILLHFVTIYFGKQISDTIRANLLISTDNEDACALNYYTYTCTLRKYVYVHEHVCMKQQLHMHSFHL